VSREQRLYGHIRSALDGYERDEILDEDRATLDEADRADVAESIAEIRALLAAHGDGDGG
jgi:hypothetical protein